MNLRQLLKVIEAQTDMAPGTDTYQEEVTRLVNESYRELLASADWNFRTKSTRLTAHPDVEITNPVVTAGSRQATAPVGTFESWMVGAYIVTDAEALRIGKVVSSSEVALADVPSESATAATVQERVLVLPLDAEAVRAVTLREVNSTGSTKGGELEQVESESRAALVRPLGQTSNPSAFVVETFEVYEQPLGDLTVTVGAGANAWPEGDYYISIGLEQCGVLSETSEETKFTITAGDQVSVHVASMVDSTRKDINVVVWIRPSGNLRKRALTTFSPSALSAILPAFEWSSWYTKTPQDAIGQRLAVALFPRQDDTESVEVTYTQRPEGLLDLQDTVRLPSGMVNLVADMVLEAWHYRAGNELSAVYHHRKAKRVLSVMRGRYLDTHAPVTREGWRTEYRGELGFDRVLSV